MRGNNKQTRYIMSWGLAFAEQGEMDKLSRLSEQGWMLERFSRLGSGYIVRRGTARRRIYCLDIQHVLQQEVREYHELFADSGWEYVCSAGNMHIFAAEPGTVPLHTDRSTLYEKYRTITQTSKIIAGSVTLLMLITFVLRHLSTQVWNLELLHHLTSVSILLCALLFLPSIMVYVAYTLRLRHYSE
ncbi:DUF2812 domain-containing protein [Paenibacillus rhizoplanae]|uniref:DUF2812 domain-containing protein n=1 Tax=Paenibacillus rhizoplanae TaxID=1917181 RepID=A0ABW5FDA1_9BACL